MDRDRQLGGCAGREAEPVGDAAAGEGVVAQFRELRSLAEPAVEALRSRLVGPDLTGTATSQVADNVMVTAGPPAWSELSQNLAWPLAMSALSTACQPEGRAPTQGTRAADGTASAVRMIEWPVPHDVAKAPIFPSDAMLGR